MKKIIVTIILSIFFCNSVFATTLFYEDYNFYAETLTDIRINKVDRTQQIQMAFPSYSKHKIPFILNGEASYKELDDKPYILLKFDKLSISGEKSIPVEILITGINGQKIQNNLMQKENRYFKSFKSVNNYTKEVLTFPINRYKSHPTKGKPTPNTFIMLLEPAYAALSCALFLISPVSAAICIDEVSPDIKRGSIIEFQFLQEIKKDDLEKIIPKELL